MQEPIPTSADYLNLATLKVQADFSPSTATENAYLFQRDRILKSTSTDRHYEILNSLDYANLRESVSDLAQWTLPVSRARAYGLCKGLRSYVEWVRDIHLGRLQRRFFRHEVSTIKEDSTISFLDVKNSHYLLLLDREDWEEMRKFTVGVYNSHYPYTRGKTVHRAVMKRAGHDPSGKLVDHANNNRFDARRVNLRLCTSQQNRCNVADVKNPNGYRGLFKVNLAHGRVLYSVSLAYNGEMMRVGRFDVREDAAIAWDIYAKKYHGAFAQLNKPDASPEEIARVQRLIDTPRTSSDYFGVSWNASHKRWRGRITVNGNEYLVGYFKDEIEAAHAVDRKRLALGLSPKRLNFPNEKR